MANIRRGFPPGVVLAEFLASAAKAGAFESSRGSERTIPAARRNLRREVAGRVEINDPCIGQVLTMRPRALFIAGTSVEPKIRPATFSKTNHSGQVHAPANARRNGWNRLGPTLVRSGHGPRSGWAHR